MSETALRKRLSAVKIWNGRVRVVLLPTTGTLSSLELPGEDEHILEDGRVKNKIWLALG